MQTKEVMPRGLNATISTLAEFARLSPTDALARLESSPEGIYQKEAEERLRIHGRNEVAHETGWDRIRHYFEHLRNDLMLPVIATAVFLILIGKTGAGWIISLVLLVSVLLSLVHSYRSGKELKKLCSKIGLTAKVHRRSHGEVLSAETDTGLAFRKIPLRLLVPGDLIALEVSDRVPADVRLIKSENLVLSQSLLSGSLLPVKKSADADTGDAENPFDVQNICLMGSAVVSGSAVGLVILTGTRTWLGVTRAWRRGEE
ncbi:MAG TPA: cation-transporting P-type ATPase [Geobacteraceae bacterium]|nr:cation-transporting P-type ATPase [Geobacteraceae bacterium]